MLAIIRSDFDHIHRDIRKLQPEELVPVPGRPKAVVPYKTLLVLDEKGRSELDIVIDGDVLTLDVRGLLNGVDLRAERARRPDRPSPELETDLGNRVRLFYSYSHKDEHLRDQLETHLKLLERQGVIAPWHDRKIGAGEEWNRQISDNLERADLILLLVSSDFLASKYCYEIEVKRALERHEAGEARVIPVIVRDVNWSMAPFSKLGALPKDGKAVELWPNRDTAWRDISEGIERAAEELQRFGFGLHTNRI